MALKIHIQDKFNSIEEAADATKTIADLLLEGKVSGTNPSWSILEEEKQ
jgi:hypothetical protein